MIKVIGFPAAVLTTLNFLPQVVKSLRTRRMAGINLLFLLMLVAGLACWTVYGFLLRDLPLIAANVATLALLGLKLSCDGKGQ